MYYPCIRCGKNYDDECINICDYARSIKILKEVLLENEPCARICKYGYPCRGIGFDCDKDDECINHSLFEINFDRVIDEYNIKIGNKKDLS